MVRQRTASSARHGVVFVHGLGEQPKSDTLLWFGRPIVDWLLQWYAARSELKPPVIESVELGFAPFDQGEADFQPRARLQLARPDGGFDTWVLAEAWWAASNLRPSFGTMANWCWRYFGVTMGQLWVTVQRRLNRLRQPKENSTDPGPFARFIDFVNTIGLLVVYGLVALAGYPLILLLSLLAQVPLPGLQDFIVLRLLQPLLQGQLGEFRTFLEDELQAANMRRRVATTIHWVLQPVSKGGGGCDDVTVIAHSGGTLVAFAALTDPALCAPGAPLGDGRLDQVRKLITVGSSLNKAWLFYPNLTRIQGPLPRHLHWLDIWTAYDSVPAGPPLPPKNDGQWIKVFQPDPAVVERQGLRQRADPDPHSAEQPHRRDWRRRGEARWEGNGATADLAYWPVSAEVTNRMIVLIDHGLYWTNDEQVLVRLVAEIDAFCHWESRFWHGGGQLIKTEMRTEALKQAVRRRRARVAWLAAWRGITIALGLASLVLVWWSGVLAPQTRLGGALSRFLLETALLQPVTQPLAGLFSGLRALVDGWPLLAGLIDFVMALPVVLLVVIPVLFFLVYLPIRTAWDRTDAQARQRAVRDMARAGGSESLAHVSSS